MSLPFAAGALPTLIEESRFCISSSRHLQKRCAQNSWHMVHLMCLKAMKILVHASYLKVSNDGCTCCNAQILVSFSSGDACHTQRSEIYHWVDERPNNSLLTSRNHQRCSGLVGSKTPSAWCYGEPCARGDSASTSRWQVLQEEDEEYPRRRGE